MALKIKMFGIAVQDPIKAHQHYTTILGFRSYMYDPENLLAIVVAEEDPEGPTLMLEPVSHSVLATQYQKGLREKKIPVITLSVEDIRAEYIRLVNLDVPFLKKPTETAWGIEAIFDDGQGNYIQLIQE
jgi:predicted enzyme related to lactoylglutathione lyase